MPSALWKENVRGQSTHLPIKVNLAGVIDNICNVAYDVSSTIVTMFFANGQLVCKTFKILRKARCM